MKLYATDVKVSASQTNCHLASLPDGTQIKNLVISVHRICRLWPENPDASGFSFRKFSILNSA